jgi:hypothetical protein
MSYEPPFAFSPLLPASPRNTVEDLELPELLKNQHVVLIYNKWQKSADQVLEVNEQMLKVNKQMFTTTENILKLREENARLTAEVQNLR